MNKVIKRGLLFLTGILVLLTLLSLYYFENIKGYYRFKEYCKNEGGLKIYGKLQKNVGWIASDKHRAKSIAKIKNVDFVRYEKNNEFYDVRYSGGDSRREASYRFDKANFNDEVVYEWKVSIGSVDGEKRLGFQFFDIIDIKNNIIIFSFKRFSYSVFDRKNYLSFSFGTCLS